MTFVCCFFSLILGQSDWKMTALFSPLAGLLKIESSGMLHFKRRRRTTHAETQMSTCAVKKALAGWSKARSIERLAPVSNSDSKCARESGVIGHNVGIHYKK